MLHHEELGNSLPNECVALIPTTTKNAAKPTTKLTISVTVSQQGNRLSTQPETHINFEQSEWDLLWHRGVPSADGLTVTTRGSTTATAPARARP